MYKGIIIDIDDTLYQYQPLHEQALNALMQTASETFSVDLKEVESAYNTAKQNVKFKVPETAASHNRLLYIQNMCEILNLDSLKHSLTLYNIYWDTFLEELTLSSGAKTFFENYGHLPICLLTDLTAHIQHRKVERLGIQDWVNFMVTSEEAGCEKPHPFMFQLALHKLQLTAKDVCMIGDSYKKDILGANSMGIDAYWLNSENSVSNQKGVIIISDLGEIQW